MDINIDFTNMETKTLEQIIDLINECKKYKNKISSSLFHENFEKAVSIRKQLQIQKRKADLKAYLNQQKTCDICQGKYIIKNKARHCRTQKHIKCEDLKKN